MILLGLKGCLMNKNTVIVTASYTVHICLDGNRLLCDRSFKLYLETELSFCFFIFYRTLHSMDLLPNGRLLPYKSYNKLLKCEF